MSLHIQTYTNAKFWLKHTRSRDPSSAFFVVTYSENLLNFPLKQCEQTLKCFRNFVIGHKFNKKEHCHQILTEASAHC